MKHFKISTTTIKQYNKTLLNISHNTQFEILVKSKNFIRNTDQMCLIQNYKYQNSDQKVQDKQVQAADQKLAE